MHVKHVSDVTLSSIQQISVKCYKISAKINIFLFVHSLFLTGLKLSS